MAKPTIIEYEDGLDIIVDGDITSWHSEVTAQGEATYIKFRKSKGKSPLSIGDITGVNFGDLDKPLGIDYTKIKMPAPA